MARSPLLFLAAACAVCVSVSAKGLAPYDTYLSPQNWVQYKDDVKCKEPFKAGFSCADCHNGQLCDAAGRQVITIPCKDDDAPWCSTSANKCSLMADVTCGTPEKEDEFPCASSGYFPKDPKDCGKYHYCFEDFSAVYLTCPTYNPCNKDQPCSTEVCPDIPPVNCPPASANLQLVPFTTCGNYFAYCYNGIAYMVDKCANDDDVLDPTTQKCVPKKP